MRVGNRFFPSLEFVQSQSLSTVLALAASVLGVRLGWPQIREMNKVMKQCKL